MVGATPGLPTRYNCPMAPRLAKAIRHEHNATAAAVRHAQARALHLGELLLEVRQELGPVVWDNWLETGVPNTSRSG